MNNLNCPASKYLSYNVYFFTTLLNCLNIFIFSFHIIVGEYCIFDLQISSFSLSFTPRFICLFYHSFYQFSHINYQITLTIVMPHYLNQNPLSFFPNFLRFHKYFRVIFPIFVLSKEFALLFLKTINNNK